MSVTFIRGEKGEAVRLGRRLARLYPGCSVHVVKVRRGWWDVHTHPRRKR